MTTTRPVRQILQSTSTMEGAGVRLKRAFGYHEASQLDPFLLLDDFHSDDPQDYLAGFPWHPHRGIETVTYMLQGSVEHGDSMGNRGIIHSGDVQWMTAGSGIIHQEMPQKQNGTLWGFQLWVNLPSSHKMMSPRYRDVPREQIPEVQVEGDLRIKVISGQLGDIRGPVRDLVVDVTYLNVAIPAGREYVHPVSRENRIFAYVMQGEGDFGPAEARPIPAEHLVIFGDGDQVRVKTEADPVRFLLISGPPLGEPIAWRGPIVMNTPEELDLAFQEYREGTFIKHGI